MSYILDALRRLEKDKEVASKGINPMEAILTANATEKARAGVNWAWRVGIALLVLVTIIISTYLITRQMLLASSETSQKAVFAEPPALAVAPSSKPKSFEHKEEIEQPVQRPRPVVAPAPLRAMPSDFSPVEKKISALPIKPRSEVKPARAESGTDIEKRLARPTKPLPFTPKNRVAADPEPVAEVEAPPLPETEEYLPWSGPEIKISAIAWSQEPKNRFAVVDLQTVRQGDFVSGLEIKEIQEDGIVFIQDGDNYKIFLGKN